jgi:hypothetical protein
MAECSPDFTMSEALPDYAFSWFGEDDEAIELVEGAAAQ